MNRQDRSVSKLHRAHAQCSYWTRAVVSTELQFEEMAQQLEDGKISEGEWINRSRRLESRKRRWAAHAAKWRAVRDRLRVQEQAGASGERVDLGREQVSGLFLSTHARRWLRRLRSA